MSQHCIDSILAVLVVYGKPPSSSNTLLSLADSLRQAGAFLDMLVYDNSPQSMVKECSRIDRQFRVTYNYNPANAGISAAYNAGARLAREKCKKWLLLLDQDTTFPSETMETYARAVREGGGEAIFVPQLFAGTKLLSPCGYRGGIAYHLKQVSLGSMLLHGRSVLNSGLLVQLSAFEKCGGYDERVRVDFADFAFMNRIRSLYLKVDVLNLICEHGFSNLEALDLESALRRFDGYCRDGRAAAPSPLLLFSHAFLVLRRCIVLTLRYGTPRFISSLPAYFFIGERTIYS